MVGVVIVLVVAGATALGLVMTRDCAPEATNFWED